MFRLFILFTFLSPIFLITSGCSIYKSESRKSFESQSKSTLNLQSLQVWAKASAETNNDSARPQPQMQCDEISEIQYWYESRLPSPQTEWLESGSEQLEVWKIKDNNGHIRIRSYEHTPPVITRCEILFNSEKEWRKFQDFYFKSLEGA